MSARTAAALALAATMAAAYARAVTINRRLRGRLALARAELRRWPA